MPRPRKKVTVPPQRPAEITRFDEANSARLGLICVQERIPSDYTRWDHEWTVEDRTARLTCISPSEYGGVPHGLDGDFATTLNLMYLEQGSPDSGEVMTPRLQAGACVWTPPQLGVPRQASRFGFSVRHISPSRPSLRVCVPGAIRGA